MTLSAEINTARNSLFRREVELATIQAVNTVTSHVKRELESAISVWRNELHAQIEDLHSKIALMEERYEADMGTIQEVSE